MPRGEFELRRKLLQLEALHDVGRALNTLRPEEDLLEELLHRAISVLDATAGFAFTIDGNLQIQHVATVGVALPEVQEEILQQEPVRRVFQMKEPVLAGQTTFLGGQGGSILIAPMISGDEIVGQLGLIGKEERGVEAGAFEEEDMRFIESLVAIGAAAVDNTRRFHRLELAREYLEDENRALRQRMQKEYSDRLMIGESPEMQKVIDLIARVATSTANVLIRGESGTGKEMVARLVHGNSPRHEKSFVAINCAALPATLLESELFGIERGVATGVEARPGKFEMANGGTVFLDEIGDIELPLQAKLLRVLQEREIEKVGGRRRLPVDVRILAATHRDLEQMVDRGEFRQDLYYRLRVVQIELPPLRERREDIPALVRFFLDRYGGRKGLENVRMTQKALQKLVRYEFPGNVRELENMVEGAIALTLDPVIDEDDLPIPVTGALSREEGMEGEFPELEEVERRYMARVLTHTSGNVSRAARILGVDRKTIYRKLATLSQNATHDPK